MAVIDIVVANYADLDFVRVELVSAIRRFAATPVAELLIRLAEGRPVFSITTGARGVDGTNRDAHADAIATLVRTAQALLDLGARLDIRHRPSPDHEPVTITYHELNDMIMGESFHR